MYLMYFLNDAGERVYTLKVRIAFCETVRALTLSRAEARPQGEPDHLGPPRLVFIIYCVCAFR